MKARLISIALALALFWQLMDVGPHHYRAVSRALRSGELFTASQDERIRAVFGERYKIFTTVRDTVPVENGYLFVAHDGSAQGSRTFQELRSLLFPRVVAVGGAEGLPAMPQWSPDNALFAVDVIPGRVLDATGDWKRVAGDGDFTLWRYGDSD